MNKILNTTLWVLLFIMLLPSSLAVASWNSLPGSHLFAVKLFMEQALVAVVPSQQAKGTLQIAYTERRFSEASRLLADKSSVQGLTYLDSQVNTTKEAILATNDPVVKQQLAQKYISALQDVNTKLEAQKQLAQAASPEAPKPTATPTLVPTPTPTPIPLVKIPVVTTIARAPTATPTPTPLEPTPTPNTLAPVGAPTGDVVGSINDSQKNIAQAISDMEQFSGHDNGNHNGNDNGNGNNGSDHGNGKGND